MAADAGQLWVGVNHQANVWPWRLDLDTGAVEVASARTWSLARLGAMALNGKGRLWMAGYGSLLRVDGPNHIGTEY